MFARDDAMPIKQRRCLMTPIIRLRYRMSNITMPRRRKERQAYAHMRRYAAAVYDASMPLRLLKTRYYDAANCFSCYHHIRFFRLYYAIIASTHIARIRMPFHVSPTPLVFHAHSSCLRRSRQMPLLLI